MIRKGHSFYVETFADVRKDEKTKSEKLFTKWTNRACISCFLKEEERRSKMATIFACDLCGARGIQLHKVEAGAACEGNSDVLFRAILPEFNVNPSGNVYCDWVAKDICWDCVRSMEDFLSRLKDQPK
jgi:hypothetical protein